MFLHKRIQSQVGPLHVVSTGTKLAAVIFDAAWTGFLKREGWEVADGTDDIILQTETQLAEYFSGKRTGFDIPLHFTGTDFQLLAWKSLLKIPFGKTYSYGEQAKHLNRPEAVRAVGSANGKNKICIIVPCHRVIGKNGALTGFAGGVEIKERLLRHEGCLLS